MCIRSKVLKSLLVDTCVAQEHAIPKSLKLYICSRMKNQITELCFGHMKTTIEEEIAPSRQYISRF